MNNQTVDELKNRNFDSCFFSLICIPCQFYFDQGDNNVNLKNLYVFYSCNLQGDRKFLTALCADDYPKTSDWYNLFLSWKNRSLQTVLYATIPHNKVLKDALSLAFKDIDILFSHLIAADKISRYYSLRYSTNLENKIHKIYLSSSLDEFDLALKEFFVSFDESPFLHDLLDEEFKYAKDNYKYDQLIRNHVLSFYFLRTFSRKMWVAAHSKNSFSSVDDFIEILLPIIQASEKRMYCSKATWVDLINHIYPQKRELIKCYF